MKPDSDQLNIFKEIVERHGRDIMEKAIEQVLTCKYDGGEVSSASKYHVEFLRSVLPVFPALTALSCKAAGGKKEKIIGLGAALTLFVEAANVHDDIIDQTGRKHSRKTTFGKFGGDIALLTGDVLLVQGAMMLCSECESLPEIQKKAVLDLTFEALVEITKSAAKEIRMRRKTDTSAKEYFEVICMRASVLEAHCKIAAILGGGTEETIRILGDYGRTFGIVGTVVDEFMDLLDFEKFRSRLRNECVPLPFLCAFDEGGMKEKITPLIGSFDLSKKDFSAMVQIILGSARVQKLKKDTILMAENSINRIKALGINTAVRDLSLLLEIVKGLFCTID